MKKIINIRGSHASGKTTAVREYVNKHNTSVETIEAGHFKSVITHVENDIIVLGRYDIEGCTGCDRYKGYDQVKATIFEVAKKYSPRAIVYEGIIYSTTCRGTLKVANLGRSLGYQYTGVFIYRELEEAIAFLEARNNGSDYNRKLFLDKYYQTARAAKNLMEQGEVVRFVDVTGYSKAALAEVVESEVG